MERLKISENRILKLINFVEYYFQVKLDVPKALKIISDNGYPHVAGNGLIEAVIIDKDTLKLTFMLGEIKTEELNFSTYTIQEIPTDDDAKSETECNQ